MLGGENVARRHVEVLQFVDGQIDAATSRIFTDIADDVGELEGEAEIVRVLERLAILVAEDLGREQADHAGDAVAVERSALKSR